MDCSLPGSSIHGILQARILEWVAISFSKTPFTHHKSFFPFWFIPMETIQLLYGDLWQAEHCKRFNDACKELNSQVQCSQATAGDRRMNKPQQQSLSAPLYSLHCQADLPSCYGHRLTWGPAFNYSASSNNPVFIWKFAPPRLSFNVVLGKKFPSPFLGSFGWSEN